MDSEVQKEAVARVRAAGTDCCMILGVGRSAGVEEVRAAYRRQALLLHPDKNLAPGAGEAFKAVSGAYEKLSGGGRRGGDGGGGAGEEIHRRFATRKPSERGGDVIDLDSDDEEEGEFKEFTYTKEKAAPPAGTKAPAPRSMFVGPPPPVAKVAVVVEYNELGMPRTSYRNIQENQLR